MGKLMELYLMWENIAVLFIPVYFNTGTPVKFVFTKFQTWPFICKELYFFQSLNHYF